MISLVILLVLPANAAQYIKEGTIIMQFNNKLMAAGC
jgi:hypothetical protein